MMLKLRLLLPLLILMLSVFTVEAQEYKNQAQDSKTSEYFSAKLILTHEPGDEIFLGILHPTAALFEDYMDADKIIAEHRNYRDELRMCDARVLVLRDILLEGTLDDNNQPVEGDKLDALRNLAIRFLRFDASELDATLARGQESYRQEVIRKMSPYDLVRVIMMQPQVRLSPTKYNTMVKADYSESPIMNLFYMRDQMISTAKGGVIGRMNSPQREKECDIVEFCLEKIGMPPLHRISGKDAYLEGGDFYPFGNTAFIGCGMRTTQQAIDELMDNDLLGCDSLVVVKDRLFSQAQMHLDTYFNIIDKDLVTLSIDRMTSDSSSPNLLLIDIYVRNADGRYAKTDSNMSFVDYLTRRLGVKIIPISNDDHERLANNFLTVGARHIMAVEGQSDELCRMFKDNGVKVTWLPLDNLRKGYGAAHCMTQVLTRER